MNKNLLKILFIGVGALLIVAGSVFSQSVSAAFIPGGGSSSNEYVEIPLNFTRDRPTTKPSPGNCVGSTDTGTDPCIDIASGIGMYKYVGVDPTPTNANIGGSNPQIMVVDGSNNTTNYTKNFAVVNGAIRVYGLTPNHKYRFNFSYVDSASPDIQKIINNMPKYCEGTTDSFSKLDKTSNEWAISRNLVDGCNRYDSEPFLPAVVGVTVPSANTYTTYNKGIVKTDAVSIKAAAPTINVSSNTNKSDDDGCFVSPSDPLRFFACPLINWGTDATEKLDSMIQNFLFVPTDQLFTPSMQKAWNTFRILGVALILIAGLVMVISQAAGMELFDAYTVRKMLPRLLVAAIGMALSWPLMQFVVTFFNDIGVWSHDLILAPFGQMANNASAEIILAPLLTATAGGAYLAISLGIAGTMSLLGTLVLAALIGLVVLALRQLVIMVAVLFAPLAIAAYILPGTQKLWTFWKDAFITSLVMFPIIMAFIATGKALATVAAASDSPEMHILSVLVYFAPYFLLPFAFKLAGGLMATVFSIANDRSRGLFDRGRKKRQEIGQERRARAASNSLWDPKHRLANSAASWMTDPKSNAVYGLGKRGVPGFKRGSAKIAGMIEHAKVEQSGKLFEEINKMGFNDKGLRALSGMHYGFSENVRSKLQEKGLYMQAPRSLSDIQQIGKILQEDGEGTEKIGGQALIGESGRLSTLFQDPEMGKASIGAAGIMGLAAHGFASSRDLANAANALGGGTYQSSILQKKDEWGNKVVDDKNNPVWEDAGNFSGGHKDEAAFALSIVSQAQQLGSRSRPEAKNGYGVMYDGEGRFLDGMVASRKVDGKEVGGGGRMGAVLDTFSSQDLAAAKGGAIKAVQPEILRRLENKEKDAGKYAAMRDNLFSWAGPYSSASADVKAQAIKIINKRAETDPEFASEWLRYQRLEDPNARTGGQNQPPDQGQQQGGGQR